MHASRSAVRSSVANHPSDTPAEATNEIIDAIRKIAQRSKALREQAAELRQKSKELKERLPRKRSR